IIGFFIFLVLRSYEKTKKKENVEEAPAPKGPTQEEILLEIRDELKKQNS
ncbi:MAG: large conductance mechanosensitive channel protein MscL, partial [Christiangramia sp.]|nr:large conductance mechanosensitive channel protein MscL [Christiangramia sp.]